MEVSEFSPFLIEEKLVDENSSTNNSNDPNGNSTDKDNKNLKETDKTAPDTGDDIFGFGYVAILLVGAVIIVNKILLKKKVR